MGIFGKPTDNKPGDPPAAAPVPPRPMAPPSQPAAASHPAPHAAAGSAPAPVRTVSPTLCVLGANTTIKGEILGDEDVVIEGTVEGQIRIGRELRIGQGGKVRATVSAQSVVVSGEMQGDCEAVTRVEIQATGRLIGNIRAPKIVIAEGAVFRGNSDMSGRSDRKDRAANS
jgi:cytoskeletal protein CcmA (bactofilin family)